MKYFTIILLFTLSSCKLFHSKKTNSSDSTGVKKDTQASAKVDTSKTKTETIHTKETVYQPQPIYIQGKDGETKVIFVPQSTKETGSIKEENNNAVFENWQRSFMDSVNTVTKSKETETKAGTDWLQILILAAVGVLLVKGFFGKFISLGIKKQ